MPITIKKGLIKKIVFKILVKSLAPGHCQLGSKKCVVRTSYFILQYTVMQCSAAQRSSVQRSAVQCSALASISDWLYLNLSSPMILVSPIITSNFLQILFMSYYESFLTKHLILIFRGSAQSGSREIKGFSQVYAKNKI